ncbi:MAG TPA: outer membrane protein transport protein [Bacteroidia bacterium]|nr:outer membrane protein transport protein [Bacteroidia bacterium]
MGYIGTFVDMRGFYTLFSRSCFFLSLLTINALAGGFEQSYQSARIMGLGGIGNGFRMGAASTFYNPGAISFLPKSSVTFGAAFNSSESSYLSPYTGNTNQEKKVLAPVHIYGVLKLDDEKSAIGLSINQPFGIHTSWPSDWTGRYIVTESGLSTWFIQPAFSYKFTENFSAGGGPVIAFGHRTLTRNINITGQGNQEEVQDFDGHGTGFGGNVGLYYENEELFAVGLTFKTSVNLKTSGGDVSFSHVPGSLANEYPSLSYDSDLKLPSEINLAASYMPIRELLLIASFSYTGWSSVNDTRFDTNGSDDLDYNSGWDMENTLSFRVGAEYEVSDKISVRAGLGLDPSPVKDEHLTPELPDADRFIGSLGLTVRFSETFSADLAFLTENNREREVYNYAIAFGGTYKTITNHFGFTLNYDF